MKRAISLLLICGMAISAGAQTMYDALRFSENNYFGTARSFAMGNAFTALGGDLGGLTINPAGSAVSNFSQVTITPGVSIAVSKAQGTLYNNESLGFEKNIKARQTKSNAPNVGFILNFDTHKKSGLKNVSFGVTANMTNYFNDNMLARGTNEFTSFMGALAQASNGINIEALAMQDAYHNSTAPWQSILGYNAGLISTYGPISNMTEYIGTSEGYYYIGGPEGNREDLHNYEIRQFGALDQTYGRSSTGSKYDYLINLGLNFSDRFYLGFNLGITSTEYYYQDWFKEAAIDPTLFPIEFHNANGHETDKTNFSDMEFRSRYESEGVGFYGKIGLIVRPVGGLRIGAAISTPVTTRIKEYWDYSAASYYTNSQYNVKDATPEGQYEYRLISPFRFNTGIAYTFKNFGLISIDYELADYSGMRYKETTTFDNSVFDEGVNSDIRQFMGVSHMFRAGIEFKPVPSVAIRAGYGLTTSPEKIIEENKIPKPNQTIGKDQMLKYVKADRHSLSAGLGFSSNGTFFGDIAFGATKYADEFIYPYNDYMDIPSPEILRKKWMYNVMLTLGFRF